MPSKENEDPKVGQQQVQIPTLNLEKAALPPTPKRTPIKMMPTPAKTPSKRPKLRDSIRVFLRIRPSSEECSVQKETNVRAGITREGRYDDKFFFDHVFGPDEGQRDVYERAARPLIEGLLVGRSGLVFAYGITGAGKTHTVLGPQEDAGILPRAMDDLFAAAPSTSLQPKVGASYMEIYNEAVYDLLVPEAQRQPLRAVEDQQGRLVVSGLSERVIENAQDGHAVLDEGAQRRQTGTTQLNTHSSRSHAVFILRVGQARLAVVDLAGAERAQRTGTRGSRLKEAATINQSLSVLGRCLEALRHNQRHPDQTARVVPFRESKLTRLFQDCLAVGRAVMVANVTPATVAADETMQTLRFASVAKDINTATRVSSFRRPTTSSASRGGHGYPGSRNRTPSHATTAGWGGFPTTPSQGVTPQRLSFGGGDQSPAILSHADDDDDDVPGEYGYDADGNVYHTGAMGDADMVMMDYEELVREVETLRGALVDAEDRILHTEIGVRREAAREMQRRLAEMEHLCRTSTTTSTGGGGGTEHHAREYADLVAEVDTLRAEVAAAEQRAVDAEGTAETFRGAASVAEREATRLREAYETLETDYAQEREAWEGTEQRMEQERDAQRKQAEQERRTRKTLEREAQDREQSLREQLQQAREAVEKAQKEGVGQRLRRVSAEKERDQLREEVAGLKERLEQSQRKTAKRNPIRNLLSPLRRGKKRNAPEEGTGPGKHDDDDAAAVDDKETPGNKRRRIEEEKEDHADNHNHNHDQDQDQDHHPSTTTTSSSSRRSTRSRTRTRRRTRTSVMGAGEQGSTGRKRSRTRTRARSTRGNSRLMGNVAQNLKTSISNSNAAEDSSSSDEESD